MGGDRLWIGTSWKMNGTLQAADRYLSKLTAASGQFSPHIQPFVIPPFTLLSGMRSQLNGAPVLIGAQNMHWENSGAWTGEVSAPMLADLQVQMVEIGHSERRQHFGETDATVSLKVKAALEYGLIPLICIGETALEHERKLSSEVLRRQLFAALDPIADAAASAEVLIAYEPVWAIGDGGQPASPGYADDRQGEIKAVAKSILGRDIPCLYGGSVNAKNCQELAACQNIDGLFIGRAAWEPEGYLSILDLVSETCRERLPC